MKNTQLSWIFERMADILEFKAENPFKVNAYRKAARVIASLSDDIEAIYKAGRLRDVPGVGEGIEKKIVEFLNTGKIKKFEEIARGVPASLIELMGIPGMGPKTLALLHEYLKVESLEDLRSALDEGKVAQLPRLGIKRAESIKKGLERFEAARGRLLLGVVMIIVERIIDALRPYCINIEPAGSLRRMKETIKDIDILATPKSAAELINRFTTLDIVKEVLLAGTTKASILTYDNFVVDLRVVDKESWGAALQYFTGAKAHNIKLRERAKAEGKKISEYGVFDQSGVKLAGITEEEVYATLGMPWIPPELREDRGEIEAALSFKLPKIVEYSQILGDIHIHSDYSDGTATIEEIANRAKAMGYKFIVIADHSRSVKYAGGLDEKKLLRQIEHIKQLNDRLDGIEVLAGSEVDILKDGSLDYPDSVLSQLDVVIAAIHMGFKVSVTERLIAACENPHVDVIAHPTGRLISSREGYEVDLDMVLDAAARTNTALEINAYYDRLDLDEINIQKAKKLGIKLAIGTDAHHIDQLWMMRLGVGIARRAWLEPEYLLNTYTPGQLKELFTSKIG